MKNKNLTEKLKSSIKKHYVRKTEFESLVKEVNRQKNIIAKLKKCCDSPSPDGKAPKRKIKKTTVETTPNTMASSVDESPDELTKIKGIGPVLEGKLQGLGIRQFSQIASWGEDDINGVSEHLSFKGRIEREEWVKQAKELISSKV